MSTPYNQNQWNPGPGYPIPGQAPAEQAPEEKRKRRTAIIVLFLVLALVLTSLAVLFLGKGTLWGKGDILQEPVLFSDTRYVGDVDSPELIADADADTDSNNVRVIIRFFGDGRRATLTSPTLNRHSELLWVKGYEYRENIITGDGTNGAKWTFTPGDEISDNEDNIIEGKFKVEAPRGSEGFRGKITLRQTPWDEHDGEKEPGKSEPPTKTTERPTANSSSTTSSQPSAREEPESEEAEPTPPVGSCEPEAFSEFFNGQPVGPNPPCDGQWANPGRESSDWTKVLHFEGGQWLEVEPAGTTKMGMMGPCYDGDALTAQGAPEEFLSHLTLCRPDEIGNF
ncbi:hypothetical protein [Corynebacterium aquatimens]|uniref:Uncharacterized protein n=1 Tax=Corynebacterium aquatimens TaxID=1190508 RepID=A0A931GQU3_9CORY|nr:hypothetical protein [Corynebacterium aquatimens]MBG6121198.1 hypothetical protein [Corynebacterium aquatimens]WJY66248.1 hypothetical protein CAQUA_07770 [Corynebacterium aquatimens]